MRFRRRSKPNALDERQVLLQEEDNDDTDDDEVKEVLRQPNVYEEDLGPWLEKWEKIALCLTLLLAFVLFIYFDHAIFHITNSYAHMGHTHAKHRIAKHYLEGRGVGKNESHAMKWFKEAADEGHPEAGFHLAMGHINKHVQLEKGEAHRLIHHAAAKGVKKAHEVLNDLCTQRGCE